MTSEITEIKLAGYTRYGTSEWTPHYEVSAQLPSHDWRTISKLAQRLTTELNTTFLRIKDAETDCILYG